MGTPNSQSEILDRWKLSIVRMCYVGYHFFQIWLAEVKISDKFCAHLQDAKKSKNECTTNKISETLKFSNLKNLDFLGKCVVGEHWNLSLCTSVVHHMTRHPIVVFWAERQISVFAYYIFSQKIKIMCPRSCGDKRMRQYFFEISLYRMANERKKGSIEPGKYRLDEENG